MENTKTVEILIKVWRETRGLIYDFIHDVPLDKLNKKLPRPGLDNFAKHLYEMALVQDAYTEVLKGNPLSFSKIEGVTFGQQDYVASSKQDLIKMLKDADNRLNDVVNSVEDWNNSVEVFGENIPKYAVLDIMNRHETLHLGQFVAFGYLLEIDFPESIITTWALPTRKEKP